MCGICGLIAFDGERIEDLHLAQMTSRLQHRGPDDSGIFVKDNVGLGHTRLSIIDLSPSGHQPMFDAARGVVIVFNGEIYNYRELRKELLDEGAPLSSQSDTEVILYLYQKYGPDCVRQLRGMFAFAIWDRRKKHLFAARDRAGIKPFYYYCDHRRFAFASEIKAILSLKDLDLDLSLPAIATFFTYGHSFAPQTIFEKIQKLPPGHWMIVNGREVKLRRYWSVPAQVTNSDGNFSRCTTELLDSLRDAVRCHLIADVPVGIFLSGGIDSSLIAALAAQQSSGPIQTFSVGFDVGGYYSELDDARKVAIQIGSDHHELVVTSFDVPALLEKLVWHYDEPFADAACMPTYLISEFARRSVKVVLSGEGGDEVFGGYRRYITQLLSAHYLLLAWAFRKNSPFRRALESRKGFRRVKKVLESVDYPDPPERYAHWLTVFTTDLREQLFAGGLKDFDATFDGAEIYRRHFAEAGADPVNRLLHVDMETWLPDTYLEKVDKATMAASLEARVPLLDHHVVEFAFALPGKYKISAFRKKFLLRAAAANLLPKSILNKPKHGFAVPLDEWFRGPLTAYVKEILLDSQFAARGYFSSAAIESLLKRHEQRQNDYGTHIWQLLNFELWHRCFLDGAPASQGRSYLAGRASATTVLASL